MSNTIVLISGANRGIGRALFELYLKKPNHSVIAANRDPSNPTSKELLSLPRADNTTAHVIKIDAAVPPDAANGVKDLASLGINHLDIVIANAGIANMWPLVSEVKIEEIQPHIVTNVYGLLSLFQAAMPLLKLSQNPIWVTVGSAAGLLTGVRNLVPAPNAAYGPTKAMAHWYTKAIDREEPWLTAFPIDPGWVQTDMGNRAARLAGYEKATITTEECSEGILKVVDAATRETHSGKMWTWEGVVVPW